MRSKLIITAGFLLAVLLAAGGCYCDRMGDDDDSWGDFPDADCDCGGLTKLIYDECNGEVSTTDEVMTPQDFAADCMTALDDGGAAADVYRCYIEAACTSDNCEEAAERFGLCNL